MKENYLNLYKHKILDLQNLKKKLKKEKNLKIIHCHGVFDIVHPGHVRHLIYAKSLADILVVSITSDKFIKKGVYRPHVPQQLRAANLASFEMVDYVIIDDNPKPLKLISYLKPNFFSKGFEYRPSSLSKATKEEELVVNKYNGKMVFTPGDVVYSSSNILETHLPNIKYEKLHQLMSENKIDFETIKKTINKFSNFKVHILGDIIIDTYIRVSINNSHNKTPTHSVTILDEEKYTGGAAIVAKHLKAAGAEVNMTSIVGDDDLGNYIKKDLKKSDIKTNIFTDISRPTTNKIVYIADGIRLLKVDKLKNAPISNELLEKISSNLKFGNYDCCIFSDFRHGIFNRSSIDILTKSIKKNKFKVADSQLASRWGNIIDFKKFDLITPNEKEARFALADQDSSISTLSEKLHKISGSKNIILKLGNKGAYCTNFSQNTLFSIDSFADMVLDPVGAGDAFLAYSTMTFLSSKSLILAGIIGSFAAACECEIDGNIPITLEMISKKIDEIKKFF